MILKGTMTLEVSMDLFTRADWSLTNNEPTMPPINSPPKKLIKKRSNPFTKEKFPLTNDASAKLNITIPDASLNSDSFSNASEIFSGSKTSLVNDLKATESVGVTIAATAKHRAKGTIGNRRWAIKPTITAVATARKIASEEIWRIDWRKWSPLVPWPSLNINGAMTINIKISGSSE